MLRVSYNRDMVQRRSRFFLPKNGALGQKAVVGRSQTVDAQTKDHFAEGFSIVSWVRGNIEVTDSVCANPSRKGLGMRRCGRL